VPDDDFLVVVSDDRGVVISLERLVPFSTVPVDGSFLGSGVPDWFRSDLEPPLDSFRSGWMVSLLLPEV
jgi:hypothetical protein